MILMEEGKKKKSGLRFPKGFEPLLQRALIDTIPDLVWLKNREGVYLTCNHRFEKFFGAKESDIVGKSDYDFFTKDLAEFFRQKDKEALEANQPTKNIEWVTFADDGHRELLETIKTPMFDSEGKLIGILGISRDITKRHEAEEALKKGEKKYKYLFDQNPVPMWIFDEKTLEFLEVNKAAVYHYGYSYEEFLGMTIKDIRPVEDIEILKKKMAEEREEFHAAGIWRHKKKNGDVIYVDLMAHLIEYEGRSARLVLSTDVTSRKGAEDKLRKLSRAIEQSPSSIIITNKTGEIEYVNPKFSKLTGYSNNEAIGENPRFLKSGSTSKDEYIDLWKTISSGGEWHGEFRNRKKNGDEYIELASISPILNNNGEITHYLAVKDDITDRKKVENDLHKFLMGIENSSDAVFITDINGTIEFVNTAFEQIYGYQKSEAIGKTPRILKSGLISPENYKYFWSTLLAGNAVNGELLNKTSDGRIIDIEASNSPILDEKGKIVGFISINRDISKRKQIEEALKISEEKYRKIFENVQDVFYQADINGLTIDISPSIYRITGYYPEELLGKPISVLYENPEHRNELINKINQDGEVWDFEIRMKTKEGELKYVSLNTHKLFDSNGKQIGLEGSARDITERKKAELELVKAKEKAEESDRLKTAFLNNISHEIRTPMNAISGFTSLLLESEGNSADKAYYAETIQNGTDQLLSIINDIVDISSITAKIVKKDITRVNVFNTLTSILDQFNQKASEKTIQLQFDTQLHDKRVEIMTDQAKLFKIISNLVSNAIKFTYAGKIEMGYYVKKNDLEIYVSDTGIGIAPENHQRIFDTFYQVENTLNRNFEGTGLGLSICKSYIEHLGGKIWLTSKLDEGTVFYFSLPMIQPDILVQNGVFPDKKKLLIPSKILVVEDDDNNFKLIESIFKSYDIQIIRAVNGENAVQIYKSQNDIDLVFMDIRMPVKDGLEATREIKEINPGTIIIVQTAYPEDELNAIEAGCSGFITKPYNRKTLLEIVEKYFH